MIHLCGGREAKGGKKEKKNLNHCREVNKFQYPFMIRHIYTHSFTQKPGNRAPNSENNFAKEYI